MDRLKIFVIGGYGYRNVGDEGQLLGNLNSLNELNNKPYIVVSTPDVAYSESIHNSSQFIEALRSCYFNQSHSRRYQIVDRNSKSFVKLLGNEIYKIRFLFDAIRLVSDALCVKYNIPIRLVNRKTRLLLRELKTSDVLFFSGGGYMTEPTLSRLWDGYLHIIIARLFCLRIVLSGQTIGPINRAFNKVLGKWLFNRCDAISLRDKKKSIECLNNLRVEKEVYSVVCDDATFCDSSELTVKTSKSYVAYQFHYWGAADDMVSQAILDRNIEVVEYLLEKGASVKLVSMTPSDEVPLLQLYDKIRNENLYLSDFSYDIGSIVEVFKLAEFTVTMKHHPIVFSIGQHTPVISLNYSEYYHHKNNGALDLFGLESYGIDIFSPLQNILNLIDLLLDYKHRQKIERSLTKILDGKKELRNDFFNRAFNK